MVVWHSPCESSTPPGSQFNKTAPLERAGAFLLAAIWWCTARAGRSHATNMPGACLDSFSWPRSGEPQGWGEQCSTPLEGQPRSLPIQPKSPLIRVGFLLFLSLYFHSDESLEFAVVIRLVSNGTYKDNTGCHYEIDLRT